jgi:hypothetical protein
LFIRKLVVPGDLRSYGGGNGLPRGVKQSPDFSRIIEEDEEEEEEEEEEKQHNDVSMILVRHLSKYSIIYFFFLASTNFNTTYHSNIKK